MEHGVAGHSMLCVAVPRLFPRLAAAFDAQDRARLTRSQIRAMQGRHTWLVLHPSSCSYTAAVMRHQPLLHS